jgi:predicted transcriptional regulator
MNTTKVPSTHSDHDTQSVPSQLIESMERFEFDSMTEAQVETAFEYLTEQVS